MAYEKIVTLEDVTTRIGDGIHGTPQYDENGKYYFINGNNLDNGRIIFKEKTKKVNESESNKHSRPLNDRTIFVSINGTIGNTAIYNNEKIMLGKSACYLNIKEDVDKYFIYYLLNNLDFQNYIRQFSTGTTIKNVSLKTIRGYKFTLPPLKRQKVISNILKNIDYKIQVNQLLIANLEELSQTLFKRWFVDFEFPNYDEKPYKSNDGEFKNSEMRFIPVEWEIGTVQDIAVEKKQKINLSNTDESYNYIGLEHMPRGSISLDRYENSEKVSGNKTLFSVGDILFGKLRPYFKKVGLAQVDGVCSTDIIVLNTKNTNLTAYLLQLITTDNFITYTSNTATGTRMPRTGIKQIFNYKIVIPDNKTLNKFNSTIKNFYDQILLLGKENYNLALLRDTLLPKLMSGEIELPDDLEVEAYAELLQ